MTMFAIPFALLVVLASCPSLAAEPTLLMPGTFVGGGPWEGDLSGEWLAFVPDPPRIIPTRVLSRPGSKPLCGPGTLVEAPAAPDALFLVRDIPQLKAGPAITAYRGRRFLHPGESLVVPMATGSWVFTAFGTAAANPGGGVLFTNYEVRVFNKSGTPELVFEIDRLSEDGAPHIIWAGDLDRDHEIDLLVDLSTDYRVHPKAFFLSSPSPSRVAPVRVAAFSHGGC
jgi:hypothetical protein